MTPTKELPFFRRLPLLLLALSAPLAAQNADVYVGGAEEDDGAYYDPADDGWGQPNGQYGGDYGNGQNDRYYGNGGYGGQNNGYGPQSGYGAEPEQVIYEGDGMRVTITGADETGTRAWGTVTIGNSAPMPLQFAIQEGPNGVVSHGQVRTPQGTRPIRAVDQDEFTTIAEFGGRQFRLAYKDPYDSGFDNQPWSPDDVGGYPNNDNGYVPPSRDNINPGRESSERANIESRGRSINDGRSNGGQTGRKPTTTTIELVRHSLGGTHTLLAPKGWKVEGGVWQPPVEAFNWLPSRDIRVTAPDGTRIHFRPNFAAFDSRMVMGQQQAPGTINRERGYINMPMPTQPGEWAQWVEQNAVRSAQSSVSAVRVSSARVVPELTAQLRRLHAPMNQFTQQQMQVPGVRSHFDQLVLAVNSSYQADGRQYEQLDAFSNIAAMGEIDSVFGGADFFNFWGLEDSVSMRAPAGTLDKQMPVLLAVVNSLRRTPEWTRQLIDLKVRLSGINHDIAMKSIETQGRISQETYKAGQELSNMIAQRPGQRSQDKGHADFVNYIRDMENYRDGSGGAVTLPSGYDRVFSNGNGQYLLTNDASVDPNPGWSQISAAR